MLERPEIPLHTNGSENDIRCQVTRRKVPGGTRSDLGRDARDTFLGLAKTCAKIGIAFWDYLGARLTVPNAPAVPPLAELVSDPRPTPHLIATTFAPLTNYHTWRRWLASRPGQPARRHLVRCLRGWLSSSRKNGAPGTANTLCRGHREISRYREAV